MSEDNVIRPDPPDPMFLGGPTLGPLPKAPKQSRHFIAFRGRADGPAGLMLAINPASVALITSAYDRKYQQNVLRIHLNNSRIVKVYEADAEHVLETLGLGEYIGDWTLNLETDIEANIE